MDNSQLGNNQELLSFISAVSAVIGTIVIGLLTYLILRFTATPRIRIRYRGEEETGRQTFESGERVNLQLSLDNVGRFYAKPASTNTELYLNFESAFDLIEARYGSVLELVEASVRRGKNNSKYIMVKGIHLFYGEPGEDVLLDVKMPSDPGIHRFWVSVFSDQVDHGVHRFEIRIIEEETSEASSNT